MELDEAKLLKIKEYIIRNYNPLHGSFTCNKSGMGGIDDVFDDGISRGHTEMLYDIGIMLGIELEEPEEPSEDEWI